MPAWFITGCSTGLGRFRRVLDAPRAELEAGEPASLSTDFPA